MAPHEENHGLDRYDHLARLDPPVRFTLPYLQQLHRELYAGTDRLAGDLRWSDAAYARGSDAYLPRRELEPRLGALTAQLHREGALVSVSDGRKWADRAGYYAAELSHAQPFRAGNGPTTRLYLQRLAEAGGHPGSRATTSPCARCCSTA